jgi:hypothetical protein
MLKNNHYIRLNEKQEIIKVFSDAFEQPITGDICIKENGARCFQEDWPELSNLTHFPSGCYLFTYVEGHIIKRTQEELNTLPEMIEYQRIQFNNNILQNMKNISIESLPDILDYIAKQTDCPQIIKDKDKSYKDKKKKLK